MISTKIWREVFPEIEFLAERDIGFYLAWHFYGTVGECFVSFKLLVNIFLREERTNLLISIPEPNRMTVKTNVRKSEENCNLRISEVCEPVS